MKSYPEPESLITLSRPWIFSRSSPAHASGTMLSSVKPESLDFYTQNELTLRLENKASKS